MKISNVYLRDPHILQQSLGMKGICALRKEWLFTQKNKLNLQSGSNRKELRMVSPFQTSTLKIPPLVDITPFS